MIETTDIVLERGIAVTESSNRHSMYQIWSPYEIFYKIQLPYFTESYVFTMQGAQYTCAVWEFYIKEFTFHLNQFGTIKFDQVK